MAAGAVVLVAEDEPAIADLLELYLGRDGYTVHVVRDGAEVVAAVARLRPAALVMDIGLPGVDGITVCRMLREAGDWTPVLFVTARDDEVDRIVGLEIGADDYIVKPFSPREVVSRVRAVLRRAAGPEASSKELVAGGIRLEEGRRIVHAGGTEVALTATEFDLLAHLMRHRRQVLRREQLLAEVWGYAAQVTTRTVDVHVAQVRAKLGDASPIRTVRGVGYVVD